MDLSELTPELRDKVLACKTPQEILTLAKEAGRKLTDEELESVAGGADGWSNVVQCPSCLSFNTEKDISLAGTPFYKCLDCGYRFGAD